MNAAEWLSVLSIGAVAGAVGQLVRTIAGLASANRTAPAGQAREPFEPARLVVGMLIGATAGAMAALSMSDQLTGNAVATEVILGLAAAGYAGADFIEGVSGKFGQTAANLAQTAPAAVVAAPAAPAPAAVAPPVVVVSPQAAAAPVRTADLYADPTAVG